MAMSVTVARPGEAWPHPARTIRAARPIAEPAHCRAGSVQEGLQHDHGQPEDARDTCGDEALGGRESTVATDLPAGEAQQDRGAAEGGQDRPVDTGADRARGDEDDEGQGRRRDDPPPAAELMPDVLP